MNHWVFLAINCTVSGAIGALAYMWADGPRREFRKQQKIDAAIEHARTHALPCGCNAVPEPACPDCGSELFFKGPTGGLSVNVKCVGCGHFWNFMGPFGFQHIDSDDRYFNHARAYRTDEL